jgi:hypothetical protein
MKATIVDLRYRMREVLKALDRNEEVEILYHGKTRGIIRPAGRGETAASRPAAGKAAAHPFFGMNPGADVEREMDALRGGRHRAV